MDQWRSYFAKSGADIWTVIEKAIILSATDFPVNFKDKRSGIAETLFSTSLLQLHTESLLSDDDPHMKEEEKEAQKIKETTQAVSKIDNDRHYCDFPDAEAPTHQMEEETLVLKGIIESDDQSESVIFEALQKLEYTQITVETLKATELGKHVNGLRKHTSRRVRNLVKQLVRNWRGMVDAWVLSINDVKATSVTGLGSGKEANIGSEHSGLPLPPPNESALLAARTALPEKSQLLNFLDNEMCIRLTNNEELCSGVESSVKDNMQCLSKSFSGSITMDCGDYDAKASTSHNWGGASEEMGSPIRCFNPPCIAFMKEVEPTFESQVIHGLKSSTNNVVVGFQRLLQDVAKSKPSLGDSSKLRSSEHLQISQRSSKHSHVYKPTLPAKAQAQSIEEKLETSKRKLSDGYQQARDVKRQHTVQVLDLPDIPKAVAGWGKMNPPARSKFASQSCHGRYKE